MEMWTVGAISVRGEEAHRGGGRAKSRRGADEACGREVQPLSPLARGARAACEPASGIVKRCPPPKRNFWRKTYVGTTRPQNTPNLRPRYVPP